MAVVPRQPLPPRRKRMRARSCFVLLLGLSLGLGVAIGSILTVNQVSPFTQSDIDNDPDAQARTDAPLSLTLTDGLTQSPFAGDLTAHASKSELVLDVEAISKVPPAVFGVPAEKELVTLPSVPDAPRWQAPPGGKALLSIIIDDIGPSYGNSLNAIDLPYPMTMAILPYANGITSLNERAQARGHEIMLHLPMEPIGNANPGPNALLADLEPDELDRRLSWALDRLPTYAGVNNHMGSLLTTDASIMAKVMEAIRGRDVFFVDSKTSAASVAARAAAAAGIDQSTRDVFLDNIPDTDLIVRQLELAAAIARRKGSAIAIGHPYPQTIDALRTWLPDADQNGIALVPVSEIIRFRNCLRQGEQGCIELVAIRP